MQKAQVRHSSGWHAFGAVALLAGLTSLAGCALINPFPKPVAPKSGAVYDAIKKVKDVCLTSTRNPLSGTTTQTQDPDAVALCDSFEYAERWRQTYVSATRQHSIARNSAALITITLAGVAVFEGLRETGNADRIARLGTTAIGVYSLTNFLTSSPRQKIYLSGAKALTCAMFESRPWLVGLSFGSELTTSVRSVSDASHGLSTAVAESGLPPDEPSVETAFRALSDGRNALARGMRVVGDLRAAGMTLRNRVDFITDNVSEAVRATEPSPESLASLFGNYAGATATFRQGIKTARGEEEEAGEQQSGDLDGDGKMTAEETAALLKKQAAIARVLGAVTKLRTHTEALNTIIMMIGDASKTVDAIKGCNPEGADSGFAVSPDAESATVEVGKTFEFHVKNNVAQPVRALAGANVDAVKLETITVKDGGFVIGVTGVKATDDDGPTLVITDGTGSRSKSIQITVTGGAGGEAEEEKAGTGNSTVGPPPADPASRDLDDAEKGRLSTATLSVKSVQCYLGVNQDSQVGKGTRTAISTKRTSTPDDAARKDAIDDAFVIEVNTAINTPAHAACKGLVDGP